MAGVREEARVVPILSLLLTETIHLYATMARERSLMMCKRRRERGIIAAAVKICAEYWTRNALTRDGGLKEQFAWLSAASAETIGRAGNEV